MKAHIMQEQQPAIQKNIQGHMKVLRRPQKDVQSLKDAFKNAYGVFVVTNFGKMQTKLLRVKTAIEAAKAMGVQHFIWSTLQMLKSISKAAFEGFRILL